MTVVPGSLLATPHMVNPQMVNMGPTEILLVLLVLVLLFGARKLPELARGSGRALRIFKSETRGLLDDEPSGAPQANLALTDLAPTDPAPTDPAAELGHRAPDRAEK